MIDNDVSVLPIPSTNGSYGVDSDGSVWRLRPWHGRSVPYTLKARKSNGYLFVTLSINNCTKRIGVHRLVAEVFYGPRPGRLDVCHLNHDRSDNKPENLCYGTRSENCKQSAKDGRYGHWRKGVKPGNTKLSESQYLEILQRWALGAYQVDIAAEYGVTQGMVSRIVRTHPTWLHK